MTTTGSTIIIDADEIPAQLPALLKAVEEQGQCVQICRAGKPVAVLQPAEAAVDPLRVHPELRALNVAADAFAPVDEEDWPQESR